MCGIVKLSKKYIIWKWLFCIIFLKSVSLICHSCYVNSSDVVLRCSHHQRCFDLLKNLKKYITFDIEISIDDQQILEHLYTSDVRHEISVWYVRHTSNEWCSKERGQKIQHFDTTWDSLSCLDQKIHSFLWRLCCTFDISSYIKGRKTVCPCINVKINNFHHIHHIKHTYVFHYLLIINAGFNITKKCTFWLFSNSKHFHSWSETLILLLPLKSYKLYKPNNRNYMHQSNYSKYKQTGTNIIKFYLAMIL